MPEPEEGNTRRKHLYVFCEEASEHLDALEGSLLELEENPSDMELIGRIFRSMHTIKGSSAMFGLEAITSVTHELETIYDLLRNGKLSASKQLVDVSLAACDRLCVMVAQALQGAAGRAGQHDDIIEALRSFISAGPVAGHVAGHAGSIQAAKRSSGPLTLKVYHIKFKPHQETMLSGIDPLVVLRNLSGMGNFSAVIVTGEIPPLDSIDPVRCYASWEAMLSSSHDIDTIRDVFMFVQDDFLLSIEPVFDSSMSIGEAAPVLGDILLKRDNISRDRLNDILSSKKMLGEYLLEAGILTQEQLQLALFEQDEVKKPLSSNRDRDNASTIRVSTDKLDPLVNLVGEMVTVQAAMKQTTSSWNDFSLLIDDAETISVRASDISSMIAVTNKMQRLIDEMRDNVMSLRMVPISITFGKFKRLVRDLADELGKEVELLTSGGDTELDKTMIEKISDPIIHVLRNCIDHGIEAPAERQAAGKPACATIRLEAEHEGANVLIHITDNGRGMDTEKIRRRAVELNLLPPGASLQRSELMEFLFKPGFSTAPQVTNISGRGVGMDVLKRNVESVRGSIRLWSEPGEGTRVTMVLPLTMAIIEGLLVSVGSFMFMLPVASVTECVELVRKASAREHGKSIALVRGEPVPYVHLHEVFGIMEEPPQVQQIVIAGTNGKRLGIVVDSVIGEHQTVIKPLGALYRQVACVSGATILGDGTVALILDINKISSLAQREEQKHWA